MTGLAVPAQMCITSGAQAPGGVYPHQHILAKRCYLMSLAPADAMAPAEHQMGQ